MNRNRSAFHGWPVAAALLAVCLPALALAAPGWMGVGLAEITPEKVTQLKLKEERGVEILTVQPDSPAAQAGLKAHDVVLELNGFRVDSVEQFSRMVRETPAGRTARLLISREGATQTVQVKLAERKGATVLAPREFEFRVPMPKIEIPEMRINPEIGLMLRTARLGIEGQSLTKQLGEYFGAPEGQGVLVTSVDKDSAAEKAGIRAGDVIIRLAGERVTGMRDLRNALRDREKTSLPVVLLRNKREMTVTVNLQAGDRGLRREDVIEKMAILSNRV